MNKFEQVFRDDHQMSLAGATGPRSDVQGTWGVLHSKVQCMIMGNGHMGIPPIDRMTDRND